MQDRYYDEGTEEFFLLEQYEKMIRFERPMAVLYNQSKKHLELVIKKTDDSFILKIKSDQYGLTTFFAEAVVNGSNEIIPDDQNEIHIRNLDPIHVRNILPSFINTHWPELMNIPITVYNSQQAMKSGTNPSFRLNTTDQIKPTKPAKAS